MLSCILLGNVTSFESEVEKLISEKTTISNYQLSVDVVQLTNDDGTTIKVDQIRRLAEEAVLLPLKSKHKVLVIHSAELMTIPAQNALLKLLEEPPEHVLIVLLVRSLQPLLPTIRSRCLVIRSKHQLEKKDSEFESLSETDQYQTVMKIHKREQAKNWLQQQLRSEHGAWVDQAHPNMKVKVFTTLHALRLLERNVNVSMVWEWWMRHRSMT